MSQDAIEKLVIFKTNLLGFSIYSFRLFFYFATVFRLTYFVRLTHTILHHIFYGVANL